MNVAICTATLLLALNVAVGAKVDCPRLPCPYVGFCEAENLIPTTYVYEGQDCPGCDQCSHTPCPQLPCPNTDHCTHGVVPTFYDNNGFQCRGCDQCALPAKRASTDCPQLPCPNTDHCTHGVVPTFYDNNGVQCRGCDQCALPAQTDAPACPHLPCPLVSRDVCALGTKQTFYTSQDGQECPGCDQCATELDCPPQNCRSTEHCPRGVVHTYYDRGLARCTGCDICVM